MEAAEFYRIIPKYAHLALEDLTPLFQLADTLIPDSWGENKRKFAIAYFVAHQIEAGWLQQLEVGGKAASVAAGQSVAPPTQIDNDFSTTYYGRMYLEIKRTIPSFGLNF